MGHYKGFSVAIVTAANEQFARHLLDLCESLGAWRQYLCVIDIGLGPTTRATLERTNVEVLRAQPQSQV